MLSISTRNRHQLVLHANRRMLNGTLPVVLDELGPGLSSVSKIAKSMV